MQATVQAMRKHDTTVLDSSMGDGQFPLHVCVDHTHMAAVMAAVPKRSQGRQVRHVGRVNTNSTRDGNTRTRYSTGIQHCFQLN